MTFAELEENYGKQNSNDWHQHKNGRAWIYKNATVGDTIEIKSPAIVFGGAISGGVISGGEISGGVISGGEISGGEI